MVDLDSYAPIQRELVLELPRNEVHTVLFDLAELLDPADDVTALGCSELARDPVHRQDRRHLLAFGDLDQVIGNCRVHDCHTGDIEYQALCMTFGDHFQGIVHDLLRPPGIDQPDHR